MIGRRRRRGDKELHELALFAREARESDYAPFSRFKVGAAVRLAAGG